MEKCNVEIKITTSNNEMVLNEADAEYAVYHRYRDNMINENRQIEPIKLDPITIITVNMPDNLKSHIRETIKNYCGH